MVGGLMGKYESEARLEDRMIDQLVKQGYSKVVKDIKRIDASKLEDIPEWFDNLLHEYQYITKYSDNRINKLCILLNRQINKLKKLIEK